MRLATLRLRIDRNFVPPHFETRFREATGGQASGKCNLLPAPHPIATPDQQAPVERVDREPFISMTNDDEAAEVF